MNSTRSVRARLQRVLWHPLTLALVLAVAVRVLPATWNYVIGTDEALYLTLGGHFAAGDGFTADGIHPHSEFDPGYPLFAAVMYRLTDTIPFSPTITANDVWKLELPARLNILLLGSLLVVPVYSLARNFLPASAEEGKQLAARAARLTAVVPALALGVPNLEAASEQLYSLALWSGWLFLWLGLTRRRALWFLLGGMAFGIAHLTRYEGAISAGVAILITLVWFFPQWRAARNLSVLRYAVLIAALLGGFLFLAAPYALYQTARTGSVFSTKSIVHQLHGEALASSDPYAWEKAYDNYERVRDNPGLYPPLPVYLWQHREQTVSLYARNTVGQLVLLLTSPTFLFLLWLPLAVIGALKFTRAQNLFLAATLFPMLVFPLSVIDGRYLLPLLPAGMLWAARGLGAADDWLRPRVNSWLERLRITRVYPNFARRYTLTLCISALFVLADLIAIFFIPRPTEYRTAGLALRGTITPQAPVLMRKRQIAFYANAAYESIPFSDLQGVLDYAKQKGAEYFVIDARTTPATRPQLVYLLDTPVVKPLEIAYESTSGPKVIVYHIVK